MKRKTRQVFILILATTVFQLGALGFGQEPKPAPAGPRVLRRDVPLYPVVAATLNEQGTVVITVNINATGRVISAKYLSGPSHLRTVAEASARRWRFNAVKQRAIRTVDLSFVFTMPSNVLEQDINADVDSPYEVEIRRDPPTATTADNVDSFDLSGDIGVPECDTYLKNYESCVFDKVPEANRAAFKSSLNQVRKAWKDLAANPRTRPSLAAACQQANEAAKSALAAYGCSW
jgi:TonB family protein